MSFIDNPALKNIEFKGWVKPGPPPNGGPEPTDDVTLDPLSGRFGIYQFKKGHRYSTDDLLTAWYGTQWCPSPREVLDLGSGISSIAMMVAWKVPGSCLTTIEAQEQSFNLARRSVTYNGLDSRFTMHNADLRDHLNYLDPEKKFDLILGCPPYWPPTDRTPAQHSQAISARLEMRGNVEDYCKVAYSRLGAGGVFALTFPWDQKNRVEDAVEASGLGIFRLRSVHFKEGAPESLGLFAMVKKQDVPDQLWQKPWIEPPLTIRLRNGQCHPEYSAVKLTMGFPPW